MLGRTAQIHHHIEQILPLGCTALRAALPAVMDKQDCASGAPMPERPFANERPTLGLVFSAGYALLSLGMLSKYHLWLPTFFPLVLIWLLVLIRLISRGPAVKHAVAASA